MLTRRKRRLEEAAALPSTVNAVLQSARVFTVRPAKSPADIENLRLRQILANNVLGAMNSVRLCQNRLSVSVNAIDNFIQDPGTFVFIGTLSDASKIEDVLGSENDTLDGFAIAEIIDPDEWEYYFSVARRLAPNDPYNNEKTMSLHYLCGRGNGVGTALVRQVERQAKRSGAKRVILESLESATTFYEKMGYTLCPGRDRSDCPDVSGDLYYCKNI